MLFISGPNRMKLVSLRTMLPNRPKPGLPPIYGYIFSAISHSFFSKIVYVTSSDRLRDSFWTEVFCDETTGYGATG